MQNQWVQLAIWFVLFIGIFYVFIIMPRKKQEKKHQDMVSSLKRGEKVVTIGGIKGEIAKVKEETVLLKVGDNVEIEFLKKAIAYKDGEQ
ncbi:MAG TPA: preprotein translocase subunit YajC [Syntrophomonadaceae bacterium]|jgi:preprotein translocase subunit YajC|nr:preprotein translocase subunit YajC [Syntrophomonadaceae bacterium]HOQ09590.1 preprotein translocase subunit YajC [Syntrophomonadaceae bacterium]HPU48142.1 preprotein translocase subunit YajC [Syntrophomonadaceae bacterium]